MYLDSLVRRCPIEKRMSAHLAYSAYERHMLSTFSVSTQLLSSRPTISGHFHCKDSPLDEIQFEIQASSNRMRCVCTTTTDQALAESQARAVRAAAPGLGAPAYVYQRHISSLAQDMIL